MIQLYEGDCLEQIKHIKSGSVDAVITDPPYPCIRRDYGMMTESDWFDMMQSLIPEVRRVLKPTGSAVFILQPNFDTVGKMRLWLWEFMVWAGKSWGIVQDAYWFNTTPMATVGANQFGLMKQAVKPCVWLGAPNCYRNQLNALWKESQNGAAKRLQGRATNERKQRPSGHGVRELRFNSAATRRGGVNPMNIFPCANADSQSSAGAHGHGAGTPLQLADWWTRYICPSHGTILDPFMGSGTMGLAAIQNDCGFIGIEKMPKYFALAESRIEAERDKPKTMKMDLTA